MFRLFPKILILPLLLLVLVNPGCGGSSSSGTDAVNNYPYALPSLYFKSSQRVVLEVYYETGADPFVGNTVGGMPYWKILEDNLTSIFHYRTTPPTLVVPKTLAEMTNLSATGKTTWTSSDILALNSAHKQASGSATEARFYIYFLNGNFNDGSSTQPQVIGVNIGGTPVLAIFKDVIRGSGGAIVQKYVEQSTMVHEMGHALGFVNNGVPMVVNHQDTAHGKHSTDSNDVMYWLNEGAADLQTFVAHYISSGDTVMWGTQTLADAQAFSQ